MIGGVLKHNPHLKGIAFDLARCEAGARAHFDRLGIADRCRFVAGSFFEEVPRGADTILMKRSSTIGETIVARSFCATAATRCRPAER